jgi:hypothetical protein
MDKYEFITPAARLPTGMPMVLCRSAVPGLNARLVATTDISRTLGGRMPALPPRELRRLRGRRKRSWRCDPSQTGKTMADTTVLARIAALRRMPTAELEAQWTLLFDAPPPPHNRRFLESRLIYRIQELA